jgi:hypothetical protein
VIAHLLIDVLAVLALAAVARVVVDLWRHGRRWLAVAVSLAAWVILLIAVGWRMLGR